MAHPQIAAFARVAEGSARPTRSIAGQNTLITRTIHDMAYDPVRDEIVVPQFFAFAVLTFKGDATGDVAPVRKIFGPHTQIKLPARLALDSVHGEIFIPQGKELLVFSRDADGDTPPLRVLKGPDTMLGASALTVDPVHNLLIVSGASGGGGGEDSEGGQRNAHLLIFNRTDSGNAKPLRVISGPHTELSGGMLTTYPPRGLVVVSKQGGGRNSDKSFVGVWSVNDNGDVPPRWTIGGPNGMLRDTRGLILDAKHQNVIISDKYVNGVLTYHVPEIF